MKGQSKIRKERYADNIAILDYQPALQKDFEEMNREWIEKYFKMERKDHESLTDPEKYILARGGHILFATYIGKIAGVCALLKMENNTYELAKMAVKPAYQGRNIGYVLGQAVLERARKLHAEKVWLESNTSLTPALKLYEKLGFSKIKGNPSPYQRCDIQMELLLGH